MTDQLQSALDALNACNTAYDVAALLRRHRMKGLPGARRLCPLARYFGRVGGEPDVVVRRRFAWLGGEKISLPEAAIRFTAGFDLGCLCPDLVADHIGEEAPCNA